MASAVRCAAHVAVVASVVVATARCSRNPYDDLTLTGSERTKVVKLHGLFKDRRVRVGEAWLANDGCDIYRSVEQDATIVAWEPVRLPHHGFDVGCDNGMTMAPELDADGYLQFGLCSNSLLVGGCAARGRYRTRNAIEWDCQVVVAEGGPEAWERCGAAQTNGVPSATTTEPSFTPVPEATPTDGPVALARQRALVRILEGHIDSGAPLAKRDCVDAPCLLHEETLDPCSILSLQSGERQVAVAPIVIDGTSPEGTRGVNPGHAT